MNKSNFGKQLLALMIVVAALLVLVACSSPPSATPGPTSTTPSATSPAPTTPTSTTVAYTVNVTSKAGIGNYLVDGQGMTLYYFTKDSIGKSTATGAVLTAWPIFNPANFVVPSSVNAADFGIITRDDGLKQATYKGWPLYYYAKDKAAGDTLGEAVGGVWFVMKSPFYTVMLQTKADLGNYLVDAKGMTLYYFTKDSVGKSTATAAIVQNWPIFNSGSLVPVSAINTADFGTITRDDGLKQATYKGYPLYYYAKDKTSGDTLGQGVNGVWFVINPANFPPQPTQTATATPTPTPTPTPTTSPSGQSVIIDLVAQVMAFDQNTLTVPAGANVTLNFNNKDSGIPHNFALYTNSSATTPIFVGQTITGPAIKTYTFTAPAKPGTYFFRCDVHPATMTGNFVVSAPTGSGY